MNRPWNAWWDFLYHENGEVTCIVQTDHPKDTASFIAEFPSTNAGQQQAQKLIGDLKAGRVDLMRMIKEASV